MTMAMTSLGAGFAKFDHGGTKGAAGVDHVVDQDSSFGGYFAGEGHPGDGPGLGTIFVDHCEGKFEVDGD